MGVGGFLLRRGLRYEQPRPEHSLLALALGYLVFSYLVLACGLLGWLTKPGIGLAMVGLLAIGIPDLVSLLRRAVRATRSASLGSWTTGRLQTVLTALLAAHVVLNVAGALAPPTEADSLAYHLATPKRWLASGRIEPFFDDAVSFLVGSFETFFTPALLFGNDRGPALLHLAFGLLVLVIIGGVWRQMGHGGGVLPWCVLYCVPLITFCSTVPKNDLALAFFATLSATLTWSAVRGRDVRDFVAAGVAAGIAFSIKATGLLITPVLTVVAAGWMVGEGEKGARVLGRISIFTGVALVTSAPWYVKNWVFAGNPLFPLLYDHLGGWNYHPAYDQHLMNVLHGAYGTGRGILDFLASPWNLTNRIGLFGGMSGIVGSVFLTFTPVALWRVWRVKGQELFLFLFSAGFYVLWFFLLEHQSRFLLPVLPSMALVVAAGMKEIQQRLEIARWIVPILLVCNMSLSLGLSALYNGQAVRVITGIQDEDAYLRGRVFYYGDLQWMNEHLDAESRILAHVRHGYYLDVPYAKDALHSLFEITDGTTPENLAAQLQDAGFTHYFRTPYRLASEPHSAALLESILEDEGVLVYENPKSLQGYRNPFRTPEEVHTELWKLPSE
jgi:hypothetical protein